MSQNQHYVPQAYLKRFLNANCKVYRLPVQCRKPPTKIKDFSPAATGYLPNFYQIKDKKQLHKRGLEDANHIENYLAANQDAECKRLLDQLVDAGGSSLPTSDALESILQILSFKHRSPVLREDFEDKSLARLAYENRFNQLATWLRQNRANEGGPMSEKALEQTLSNVKAKLKQQIEDVDFATNLHTEQLLAFFETTDTVVHEVANELLKADWRLYKTSLAAPFITSDNPGFTVDRFEHVQNLGFGDANAFCFPLSPLYCLFVCHFNAESDVESKVKHIAVIDVAPEEVADINANTYHVSYRYVYSNDGSTLIQAWHEYMK